MRARRTHSHAGAPRHVMWSTDPRTPNAGTRTHVLLDDRHEPSDAARVAVAPSSGLTPREQADRILEVVLRARGPVLLCMPGTLGAAWQSSMYETARAVVRQHGGPISAVSIPYRNGIADGVGRFLGIGTKLDTSVLAMVIRGIHEHDPSRPILVAGESQGAWAVAHDLQDPALAAAVTRVVLFAKPGFQSLPRIRGAAASVTASASGAGAAQARDGASMLPGPRGIIEFRHTDDIVPALFRHLGPSVLGGYVQAIRRVFANRDFEYTPHHYDEHGPEAATYLLTGRMPASLQHPSSRDM